MIDNKTIGAAIGFLIWFHQFYGLETTHTYMQIAKHYKQCNYGTIRNYMIELRNADIFQLRIRETVPSDSLSTEKNSQL